VVRILLGFLIGIISENEGIAVLFSLIISFPLMLVSGIFFPTQTLPSFIGGIANLLPLNYQIAGSKAVLLFGVSMDNTWMIISFILFGLVYYFVKRRM
jgi:ABC-2 type transport system permease protein